MTFLSFDESYGFTHAGVGYLLTIGTKQTCYFLISLYGEGVIINFLNGQNGLFEVYIISIASQMLW